MARNNHPEAPAVTAVVSRSFKFKPEIDKAITTLEETGIRVLELGYALSLGKPIYAKESLDYEVMEIDDLSLRHALDRSVTVLPPEQVASHYAHAIIDGAAHIPYNPE